jgi:hypothetical protein
MWNLNGKSYTYLYAASLTLSQIQDDAFQIAEMETCVL